LQIFNPEVTLIHDQVWINVGAYGPYLQYSSVSGCVSYHVKGVLNPNFRPFSFELKNKLDFLKYILI